MVPTLVGVTSSSSLSSFAIERSWTVDTPASSSSSKSLFSLFGSVNFVSSSGGFDSSVTSLGLAAFYSYFFGCCHPEASSCLVLETHQLE